MTFPMSERPSPASFRLVRAKSNSHRIVAFDEDGKSLGIVAFVANERLCECLVQMSQKNESAGRRIPADSGNGNAEAATSHCDTILP